MHCYFQLQSHFADGKEGTSYTKDLLLKPQQEMPVRVLFAPTRTAIFHARLQIKQEHLTGMSKYTVRKYAFKYSNDLSFEKIDILSIIPVQMLPFFCKEMRKM